MAKLPVRVAALGLATLLGVGALVRCKKATPCRVTLTFADRPATGEGPDQPQALGQACATHCIEHDPLVDGKFRVWRAAGGKGAGKRAEAIQSVPVLKRYFDACKERCAKEAKDVKYAGCSDP